MAKISKLTIIGIILLGLGFVVIMISTDIGLLMLATGCIMIGTGITSSEIKFQIDKKNGKYKVINATIADYEVRYCRTNHGRRVKRYIKIYDYIEDGEHKSYRSNIEGDKDVEIGQKAVLYMSVVTNEIREETEWFICIMFLLITSVMAIALLYSFIQQM